MRCDRSTCVYIYGHDSAWVHMYCTHPSCMLVRTCKSHWKVGGYQTHLFFHSVWTTGAVLVWLPSPSLQSPCTSTAQGPHVHKNTITMQIILHTVCTYTVILGLLVGESAEIFKSIISTQ